MLLAASSKGARTHDLQARLSPSSDLPPAREVARRRAPAGRLGWPRPGTDPGTRVHQSARCRRFGWRKKDPFVRTAGAVASAAGPCTGRVMPSTLHRRGARSEPRCALRMRQIELGRFLLTEAWYKAFEVAERYDVHEQTLYKGAPVGHPLYPVATAEGTGERPRIMFSREAIEAADRARLLFYKTTPSWHQMMRSDAPAPPRRSAAAVIAEAERGNDPA